MGNQFVSALPLLSLSRFSFLCDESCAIRPKHRLLEPSSPHPMWARYWNGNDAMRSFHQPPKQSSTWLRGYKTYWKTFHFWPIAYFPGSFYRRNQLPVPWKTVVNSYSTHQNENSVQVSSFSRQKSTGWNQTVLPLSIGTLIHT